MVDADVDSIFCVVKRRVIVGIVAFVGNYRNGNINHYWVLYPHKKRAKMNMSIEKKCEYCENVMELILSLGETKVLWCDKCGTLLVDSIEMDHVRIPESAK